MTNSYNDMQNSKAARCTSAANAAEAHPVSMLHMLHAKETGCKMIVVDPRFTRTAAKADQYVRIRSGTDIPFLFGVLHHIFKNGWEDKKYIDDRVYGMDKVREDVMTKWTPDKVQEVCGVDEATVLQGGRDDGRRTGRARSSGAWARPSTRSATPSCAPRASCSSRSATSACRGGGANIFRGHDNVQGATDVGPNPDSLPGYYGLAEGALQALRHACGASTSSGSRSSTRPGMMNKPGMTVSRWIDGVLEKNELIDQDSNLRGMFFWGHAPNSQTRGLEMKTRDGQARSAGRGRPVPERHRRDGGDAQASRGPVQPQPCGLPAAGARRSSRPAARSRRSNRSLQWREQVIEPLWESRTDHMIMYQLAQKLGFDKELVKNYKMQQVKAAWTSPVPEDILREINQSSWTIGYTGQSPERLKAHMRNMNVFDVKTLRAKGGIDKETGYKLDGDYFGLPWPCYGTPEIKHPGSPNLYDTRST